MNWCSPSMIDMISFLHRFRPSGELKQRRRRQRRKLLVKSEFILFQNSSLIFHVVQFFQYWLIFLESNSTEMYPSLKDELENRCLVTRPQQNLKIGRFTSWSCTDGKEMWPKNCAECAKLLFCLSEHITIFSSVLVVFAIKKANSGEKSKLAERRFIHPLFLSSV